MNTYHVYAVVNVETKDAYVGCTSRVDIRWTEHRRRLVQGLHSSPRFQSAWNEYGVKAFRFVILEILIDVASATAKRAEIKWIAQLGSYNETGADPERGKFVLPPALLSVLVDRNRTRARTPEQRANMSKHSKRRWADPVEREAWVQAIRAADNGKYKGMPCQKTPEQLAEHSKALRDAWADPERRVKLKERQESRWNDPEAKARQAEKMRAYHAARRALGTTQGV